MKKYLAPFTERAIIPMQHQRYLLFIIMIAPFLNFLAGLNIDIYSPSMPSIAHYFNSSIIMVKYTIAITVFGIAVGSIIFGTLIDVWGRKRILVFSLLAYFVLSMLTPLSNTIHEIMLLRFLQGAMIASLSIGCRALIVDHIVGRRYKIAILYTSIGYGLGPVIGPFIGGWLQYFFGWKACFFALALISIILLILLVLFVEEKRKASYTSLKFNEILNTYYRILTHKKFMAGTLIIGLAQVELLTYPTLGPFIVENLLNHSVLTYANSALFVGLSYLLGTLANRILLNYLEARVIIYLGLASLVTAVALSYILGAFYSLNMLSVASPVMLICLSVGLIFSNIMAENVRLFSKTAGTAMAVLAALITTTAALGLLIESQIHVHNLLQLAILYSGLIFLQLSLFFWGY